MARWCGRRLRKENARGTVYVEVGERKLSVGLTEWPRLQRSSRLTTNADTPRSCRDEPKSSDEVQGDQRLWKKPRVALLSATD